jgi:hypothetical protein
LYYGPNTTRTARGYGLVCLCRVNMIRWGLFIGISRFEGNTVILSPT